MLRRPKLNAPQEEVDRMQAVIDSVYALYTRGLHSHGLHSYGLYSCGLYSCGLYSCGLYSYGLGGARLDVGRHGLCPFQTSHISYRILVIVC